jgi:UDP-N-acetylglucosamine transferase subunit ALG13
MDEYARSRAGKARFVFQHGYSPAPAADNVEATAMLGFDEFQALLRAADVLVAGGPITLLEGLELGIRPLCVPRELARGEHIDNNQVDFARLFADLDKIEYPADREALYALLDEALEDPGRFRFDPTSLPEPVGIRRTAEVVDALVWGLEVPGA